MCTGMRQRPLGQSVRLFQTAGQHLRLPQGEMAECLMDYRFHCSRLLHRLCEQRHSVDDTPRESRCRPKGRDHQ
jgi:hypothetical protein